MRGEEENSAKMSIVYALAGVAVIAAGLWAYVNHRSKLSLNTNDNPALVTERTAVPEVDVEISFQNPQNSHPQPFIPTPAPALGREQMTAVLNATVFITDGKKLGSGFFITADGYILSNSHVTKDMENPLVLLRDGRQLKAEKIREDTRLDVSLIKVGLTGVEFLKLGDANKLFPGQNVITIGNPGGLSFTVTRGIVSYVGRDIKGVSYIQTDAAINKGNSGGPMITENLEVVGINSMTSLNEQGISFALPINYTCSPKGIAFGLSTEPSICSEFQSGNIDPYKAAMQLGGALGPQASYKTEADELKQNLEREEAELDSRIASLQASTSNLQEEIRRNPLDGDLRSRHTAQIEKLQKELQEIPKLKAEARIRYINNVIGVLERQRGDPFFQALSADIGSQIDKLLEARRNLQDYVATAN